MSTESSAPSQAADTIMKTVKVNRDLNPQQVLNATRRVQYTDEPVVATMPSGGNGAEENVTVEFFKPGFRVGDDGLADEYRERGLTPDPYAQAAVNAADPAFADKHRNGTHWKDANGNWCSVTFDRDGGKRCVSVHHGTADWHDDWWFGGVRK